MSPDGRIIVSPLQEEEAFFIAQMYIREQYGTIPSAGTPVINEGIFKVPIEVKYPRVLMDKTTNRPRKVRYMNFENIGEIIIDAYTGDILGKPWYREVKSRIQSNLNYIQDNVQMALIKSAANKFSKLAFSEHMYSPIIDIISNLLLNDEMDITNEIGAISEKDRERYLKIISSLSEVGLIEQVGNKLKPNNILIGFEMASNDLHEQLSNALAHYLEKEYTDIPNIHQVVGGHLTIAGYIYQQSIEYDDITPINYDEIQRKVRSVYRQEIKQVKIPRYLIQLNHVDLIDVLNTHGEDFYQPTEAIFEKVNAQEQLISPVRNMFIENEAVV
jgi:hypothetical protein